MAVKTKAKKKPSLVLIAITSVVGFCVICVAGTSVMNSFGLIPTRTPTTIPTSTIVPTSTLSPTNTSSPEPSLTPTSELALDLYYSEMLKRIDAYQAAYIKFMRQHQLMSDSPQLLNDPSWKLNMGSALGSLQVAAEDLQTIPNKTPRYDALDSTLILLGAEAVNMVKNYTTAVDNVDATYLERAKQNIIVMNQYAAQATNELSALDPANFSAVHPTALAAPTLAVVIPTNPPAAGAVCSCSGDTLNCGDFSSYSSANACFNYCISVGAGDIHRLDGNNDGSACDSLK